MRTLAMLTSCLLLLALPASAGERPPVLLPEDLELLPLEHTAFGLLAFEHRALLRDLEHCVDRLAELSAARADDDDKAAAWREAQRRAAAKDLQQAAERLAAMLQANGLAAETLAGIAAFPRGPLRVDRYALAHVRQLQVGERAGPLVRATAAATLGALLALEQQRRRPPDEHAEASHDDGPAADARRERLASQQDRTRRRFWQLVDVVLEDDAKRTLRARLPHPLREIEDRFDHAMHLPKLTVGQMARIRAFEAELESEAGPDHVLAERLERRLADPALTDEARAGIHRDLEQTWMRVVRREHEAKRRLAAVLNEEQRALLEAVPPLVSVGQRLAEPALLLRGVELSPAQTEALVPLVQALGVLRRRVDAQMGAMERQIEEMGADSPQGDGVAMREGGLAGELMRRTRSVLRSVFLDVMTADQVVQWIVVEPLRDD